jgi:hypothetical protein
MSTDIEINPKLAKGIANAMQQIAGVAKLYRKYGGWFVQMPVQEKVEVPHRQRKPGAKQIKRTLKWLR